MKKLFWILCSIFMLFFIACNEENSENSIKSISVLNNGTGIYVVNTEINLSDYKLQINYSDKTTNEVDLTKNMCSKIIFESTGLQIIDVEYEENGKSYKTAFTVTIVESNQKEIEKIEVINNGDNVYKQNSTIILEDFSIKVYYTDSTNEILPLTGSMCSKIKFDELGEQSIDVVYNYNNKEFKTSFIVNVLDEWDYDDYLKEKQEQKEIVVIIEELRSLIPYETEESITLPTAKDYDYKYTLKWKSSNPDIMTSNGIVIRAKEDVLITLTLTISGKLVENQKYNYEIIIKGKGEPVLKDINTGDKLVFAYAYEGTYIPIKEKHAENIDVINYCFGYVIDGKLQVNLSHMMELQDLRYKYGVRLVLSIGNYRDDTGYYGGFGPACKTKASRTILINSIIEFLQKYDFDGIDIDWEYPGWSGLDDSSPEDKDNFVLLCSELRIALDNYKKGLLLTSAVISGLNEAGISKFYNVKELNKYLDYIHIMTYDMNSSSTASHHTNLYSGTRGYSTENSVKCFIALGATPSKLVIGAAFYGKISELSTPTTNLNSVLDRPVNETNTIQYTDIVNGYMNKPGYEILYDEANGANYITNGTYFITYDSPKTIALKVDMVVDYELGGVMFWDYGSDSTGELMDALSERIQYVNNK